MVRCDFRWIVLSLCIVSSRRRRFIVTTARAVAILCVVWVVYLAVYCHCSAFDGCVVRQPRVLLRDEASIVEVEETMQTSSLFVKAGLCAEMKGDR